MRAGLSIILHHRLARKQETTMRGDTCDLEAPRLAAVATHCNSCSETGMLSHVTHCSDTHCQLRTFGVSATQQWRATRRSADPREPAAPCCPAAPSSCVVHMCICAGTMCMQTRPVRGGGSLVAAADRQPCDHVKPSQHSGQRRGGVCIGANGGIEASCQDAGAGGESSGKH